MANSWTNADGLTIYFGTGERSLALDGDYEDYVTGEQVYEFLLDLTTLTTTTAAIANVRGRLPSLARVVKCEIVTQVAAATGTSVSIGMAADTAALTAVGTAGASIVSALVTAAMSTVGETTVVTAEATYAGDKMGLAIGTTVAPVIFTAKIAGSTFTTGLIRVKVFFQRILATA